MRKRDPRRFGAVAFGIATINLALAARSPGFEQLRTVTFIQILCAGMLLGAGLVLLLRRPSQP